MKIYDKIIQGSPEWHEIRYGKVGGSTIGKLMSYPEESIRTNSEYYKMLSESLEDFDPFEESPITAAMARGNEFEPIARQEYERITGLKVQQVGWVEKDNGFVGISPDGIVSTDHNIEIKCPSKNTHAKYMVNNNAFIEKYAWQIAHNFYVMPIKKLTCISYRPENKLCPLLFFDVTLETEIQISSKVKKTISQMCDDIAKRMDELQMCINEDVAKLTPEML